MTVYNPTIAAIDPMSAAGPAAGVARADEPARVTRWKNALLDLSLRNRLINFTPRSARSLAVPDVAALEDLLQAGRTITLRASDDLPAVERERGVRHGRDLPAGQLQQLLAQHVAHVDSPQASYQTRMRGLA